jgi:hypothetical protein
MDRHTEHTFSRNIDMGPPNTRYFDEALPMDRAEDWSLTYLNRNVLLVSTGDEHDARCNQGLIIVRMHSRLHRAVGEKNANSTARQEESIVP